MNYVVNAMSVSETRPAAFTKAGHPGSIADFIQALRAIGARPTVLHAHRDLARRRKESPYAESPLERLVCRKAA